jgi:hypothetical protein
MTVTQISPRSHLYEKVGDPCIIYHVLEALEVLAIMQATKFIIFTDTR